jgi:(4S)-4-hydroxy-5-phosphonooxypentane-2,3-dione isomerase
MQPGPNPAQPLCTLTVRFDVRPDFYASFLTEVRENAALSVLHEPGCLRFDVLVSAEGTDHGVLLYEIYRARADFDLHLTSSHYRRFDTATKHMVLAKQVAFHQLYEHAKADVASGPWN